MHGQPRARLLVHATKFSRFSFDPKGSIFLSRPFALPHTYVVRPVVLSILVVHWRPYRGWWPRYACLNIPVCIVRPLSRASPIISTCKNYRPSTSPVSCPYTLNIPHFMGLCHHHTSPTAPTPFRPQLARRASHRAHILEIPYSHALVAHPTSTASRFRVSTSPAPKNFPPGHRGFSPRNTRPTAAPCWDFGTPPPPARPRKRMLPTGFTGNSWIAHEISPRKNI